MNTGDFDFELPQERIAQTPADPRDSSRLMVVNRESGTIEHRIFRDVREYLRPGDLLVVNRTRVIPARLYGHRDTGARIEVILLKRLEGNTWETLVKPGRKVMPGARIEFGGGLMEAVCTGTVPETGGRILSFRTEGVFEEVLDQLGLMPLPPYITEELKDRERYQTVYSREAGSAAAPTAGLHFTRQLLEELDAMGVERAEVILHVGLGTFRPVKADRIEDHHMHSEEYEIPEETADALKRARQEGRRIVAVGTTTVRCLESLIRDRGEIVSHRGATDIFIYPGYRFTLTDAMITNFHLPKSTLIMMVSAFMTREKTLEAYRLAVEEQYRFFSFGDAMLIL